jgi:hypothetical protein
MRMTAPGRTWPRVGKNPGFFTPSPVVFLGFLGFGGFLGFFMYLPRRESFQGFPVSRILFGASRL